MEGLVTGWRRPLRAITLLAACWLSDSCATFEESGLPGSASSMARNQMMLVRKEPSSFGYYRLSSLERIYPDLALFVARRGIPDFLAETSNRGRSYFILYYLQSRQAFVSRNRPGHRTALEFSGPYPITEKEYGILDGMRDKNAP